MENSRSVSHLYSSLSGKPSYPVHSALCARRGSLLYSTLRPRMTSSSDLASWPFLTKIIHLRECICLPLLSACHIHLLPLHATVKVHLLLVQQVDGQVAAAIIWEGWRGTCKVDTMGTWRL